MQAHSHILRIRITDLMQTKLIGHISNLILSIDSLLNNYWWRSVVLWWEIKTSLLQSTLEYFHKTMGISMVVHWTAFSWCPHKY
jgi:hypothetical protein